MPELLPDQPFRVAVGPCGIVRLRWARGVCITGVLVVAAQAAVDGLNGDRERPLLVDMAGTDSLTRDARGQFARRCSASRVALLGESAVDRICASFAPPRADGGFPVPTRFFTSEPAALAWLLDPAALERERGVDV